MSDRADTSSDPAHHVPAGDCPEGALTAEAKRAPDWRAKAGDGDTAISPDFHLDRVPLPPPCDPPPPRVNRGLLVVDVPATAGPGATVSPDFHLVHAVVSGVAGAPAARAHRGRLVNEPGPASPETA